MLEQALQAADAGAQPHLGQRHAMELEVLVRRDDFRFAVDHGRDQSPRPHAVRDHALEVAAGFLGSSPFAGRLLRAVVAGDHRVQLQVLRREGALDALAITDGDFVERAVAKQGQLRRRRAGATAHDGGFRFIALILQQLQDKTDSPRMRRASVLAVPILPLLGEVQHCRHRHRRARQPP